MIDAVERPDTTEAEVILGVDTHLEFHVAVTVDHLGRRLGESSVPTTVKGYEGLLSWAEGFSPLRRAGVEGTSSYGAGLARHSKSRGIEVLEVERPKHRRPSSRRNLQKSDSSDAEAAARAVLAGETSGVPKSAGGEVEMIRVLRAVRRSAIKARTQAANQLQALRVTAPGTRKMQPSWSIPHAPVLRHTEGASHLWAQVHGDSWGYSSTVTERKARKRWPMGLDADT